MTEQHNTYFLLLKDRSGNVDEKTGQAKEAVKALLIDNKLWNESEISHFEYHYPLGLIAIQCSDEVIELIKAQASLIGDVTKIESEEQSQEYLFTKVMNPEDVERFLHDINDPSF